jgi:hypothetical protein
MQTLNANQNSRSDDPVWFLIAEFLLSDFFVDHNRKEELTAGNLFQAVRELGMPPECVENIEMTLAEFVKKALVHFQQEGLELPGRIRVFCQKKIIDDANFARAASSSYQQEQAVEHAQRILDSGTNLNRGWGYFIIDRSGSDAGSSEKSSLLVELYLYLEGE